MRRRLVENGTLVLAAVLLLLHFLHLRADFPNHSPWNDWAKYTDEGWYGDAAIRHYLRGTWHLPGDFNAGVALPVWPLMEALLFRFTGVGIIAARALTVTLFGCTLLASFLLLHGRVQEGRRMRLRTIFAAAACVLLAASPFLYAFSRMAILEPLLVLLTLLALLAAYVLRRARERLQRIALAAGVGLLVALMIGTKTTAIFLLPAVTYMLAASAHWRWRRMLATVGTAAAAAALPCAIYLAYVAHYGYLRDFRYLFSANGYTGITRATLVQVVHETFHNGLWMGPLLYPVALIAICIALLRRNVWRDPVFVSLLLWVLGYFAFLAYHANPQPRYYFVIAVPLALLLARAALHLAEWNWLALYGLLPLMLVLVVLDGAQMMGYVQHPEYSFQTAAERIEQVVESEPGHSHTVLSVSGSDLSLMTGLPSICDDFGTMVLEDRIATYKPGWFVSWNYLEDDKMATLSKFYSLTRVAQFAAMDDPDRNLMIVYRLDAKAGTQPKRRRPGARVLPMHLPVARR